MLTIPELWLGDDASLMTFLKAQMREDSVRASLPMAAGFFDRFDHEPDDSRMPIEDRLAYGIMDVYGSIGVVRVEGTLTNEVSIWNPLDEMIAYDTISLAVDKFVQDDEISHIVMSYQTGGGTVSGMVGAAKNLRAAGTHKPLISFANSVALSAGYWLATEGQRIVGDRIAEVGSIGTIMTHMSMHRMLKERGIDATVFRSGKDKALGHPMEPLSDRAKQALQKKVEIYAGFFHEQVVARRPVSMDLVATWGEGRAFFMEEATQVGLADKVQDFSSLLAELAQMQGYGGELVYKAYLDATSNSENITASGAKEMKRTVILTKEAKAALAAGAAEPEMQEAETSVQGEQNEEATPVTAESASAAEDSPDAEESTENVPSLVGYLREELKTSREETVQAKAEVLTVKAKMESLQADVESLRPMAENALELLQIRMGHTPLPCETMSATAMFEMYAPMVEAFNAKFKEGRQSVADPVSHRANGPRDIEREAAASGIYPKRK